MPADPTIDGQLPVACTLSPSDLGEQRRRWHQLGEAYQLGRSRSPGQLLIRYRAEEPARRELADLVNVERQCCAFLSWTVSNAGGELHLIVSGRDTDLDVLTDA